MKVRVITLFVSLMLVHISAKTASAQGDAGSAGWQATVKLEAAVVYSAVSASSRVVTTLKRGDVVFINMEFTSTGGTWYAVSTGGPSALSGYLSGSALEVTTPTEVASWEYQPPPEPVAPAADASTAEKESAIGAASKGKIERDIKSFFVSKFGRSLPVSAFGQTRLHSRLGFDHRNGIDVALSPDSAEGRAVINKLRAFGVPFIGFRRAIPGVATGAHIHVGRPSPRR
jgi:hypothetical protein